MKIKLSFLLILGAMLGIAQDSLAMSPMVKKREVSAIEEFIRSGDFGDAPAVASMRARLYDARLADALPEKQLKRLKDNFEARMRAPRAVRVPAAACPAIPEAPGAPANLPRRAPAGIPQRVAPRPAPVYGPAERPDGYRPAAVPTEIPPRPAQPTTPAQATIAQLPGQAPQAQMIPGMRPQQPMVPQIVPQERMVPSIAPQAGQMSDEAMERKYNEEGVTVEPAALARVPGAIALEPNTYVGKEEQLQTLVNVQRDLKKYLNEPQAQPDQLFKQTNKWVGGLNVAVEAIQAIGSAKITSIARQVKSVTTKLNLRPEGMQLLSLRTTIMTLMSDLSDDIEEILRMQAKLVKANKHPWRLRGLPVQARLQTLHNNIEAGLAAMRGFKAGNKKSAFEQASQNVVALLAELQNVYRSEDPSISPAIKDSEIRRYAAYNDELRKLLP